MMENSAFCQCWGKMLQIYMPKPQTCVSRIMCIVFSIHDLQTFKSFGSGIPPLSFDPWIPKKTRHLRHLDALEATCLGSKLPRSLCAIGLGSCLDRNLRWMPVDPFGSELYLDTRKTTIRQRALLEWQVYGVVGSLLCSVACLTVLTLFFFVVGKDHCEWKWRDWMEFWFFDISVEDLTILFCKGKMTARYWEMSCFMTPSHMMSEKSPGPHSERMALVHPWQMLPGNSYTNYYPCLWVLR